MSGKRNYTFSKRIRVLKENFDNVRFTKNYCRAVYKGNADNLGIDDLIDECIFLDIVVFK